MGAFVYSVEAEAHSLKTWVKVSAKAVLSADMVGGDGTGGTKRIKRGASSVAMVPIWCWLREDLSRVEVGDLEGDDERKANIDFVTMNKRTVPSFCSKTCSS